MLKTIVIFLTGLVVSAAHAERAGIIMGVGQLSCGEYVGWRTTNNTVAQVQAVDWTLGLISAYNVFGDQTAINSAPKYETVSLYLEKHSRDHPLDTIASGSFSLIRELSGWRPKK